VTVTVGRVLEPRSVGPVTITDVVRFAGAGGDFNPLHHNPDYARAAGFDPPIAMGQYTAGLLAAFVTDWCGVEQLRRYAVRFTAPLPIGATVVLSGTVSAVADGVAHLDLQARHGGTVLVTGTADIAVGC
jgi:acyl dehydratase